MSKLNKLYAKIILQCCNDTDGIYNLLLTKLLPNQIEKIKFLKDTQDLIQNNDYQELYNDVYNLSKTDPIIYIMLTDDLVDIKDRDKYISNIENSNQYPDELKCIALEAFKQIKENSILDEDAGGQCCAGGEGLGIAAGGDISPLAGEIGSPPPHFSDKFNHNGLLPMKKINNYKTRPLLFPSLGMYSEFYNNKFKKKIKKKK